MISSLMKHDYNTFSQSSFYSIHSVEVLLLFDPNVKLLSTLLQAELQHSCCPVVGHYIQDFIYQLT